jgi:hypothetical protein
LFQLTSESILAVASLFGGSKADSQNLIVIAGVIRRVEEVHERQEVDTKMFIVIAPLY